MRYLPNNYVFWGLLGLVLGSLGLGAYAAFGGATTSEIFRFITLLILFMTALAITATVFSGLSMGNAQEAFGLPSGSVRALLAVGIMILFVVFGLPLINPSEDLPARIADQPLATTTVSRADLAGAINQHQAQGLVVVVTDYGRVPSAGPPADAGTPAKIAIYQRVKARPVEEMDIARQLLTAIVTLLTTVVGFYFGSRSASDGIKSAEAARVATAASIALTSSPNQPGGDATPPVA